MRIDLDTQAGGTMQRSRMNLSAALATVAKVARKIEGRMHHMLPLAEIPPHHELTALLNFDAVHQAPAAGHAEQEKAGMVSLFAAVSGQKAAARLDQRYDFAGRIARRWVSMVYLQISVLAVLTPEPVQRSASQTAR